MTEIAEFGRTGESLAVRYLESHGLKLVESRFQTRWGEIDAIMKEKDVWVFVEVKARRRASEFAAVESITPAKQRRLKNAALMYMKQHRLEGQSMRFDVVTIEGAHIDWIPDAFKDDGRYTF